MFTKGQKVAIINKTFGGQFVVEGHATITRILNDSPYAFRCNVRFEGQRGTFARYIDPDAQANPQAYCDKLNAECARVMP